MSPEQVMDIVAFALKCLEESDINSAVIALTVIQVIAKQSQEPPKPCKLRVI
ncbi:MAG: hypothetical protein RLY58_2164 [Pseudomonadota bacterium]|jgi:hypothetical protein